MRRMPTEPSCVDLALVWPYNRCGFNGGFVDALMLWDYGELKSGREISRHRYCVDHDLVADYLEAVQDHCGLSSDGADRQLVPAMAVAALSIRGVVQDLRIPGGTLHVGQEFEFSGGVAVGSSLDCVATLTQNSVRGDWRFLGVECQVNDGDGYLVMTGKSTIMIPADLGPRANEDTGPGRGVTDA